MRSSCLVKFRFRLLVCGFAGILASQLAGQQTPLQRFKRWLADQLKIDFSLYDRISVYRGPGAESIPHGASLRVFDLARGMETVQWRCDECWSPVMNGSSEVLVLSTGNRLVGYDLATHVAKGYAFGNPQPPIEALVAVREGQLIALVRVSSNNANCALRPAVFRLRREGITELVPAPEGCIDSPAGLFPIGALRNSRIVRESREGVAKLKIHQIRNTGGLLLEAPGQPLSKTLDSDGISRFSAVWVDDSRILYLGDK
jgi:hypothetical protein